MHLLFILHQLRNSDQLLLLQVFEEVLQFFELLLFVFILSALRGDLVAV
jgi:hypothetical protein